MHATRCLSAFISSGGTMRAGEVLSRVMQRGGRTSGGGRRAMGVAGQHIRCFRLVGSGRGTEEAAMRVGMSGSAYRSSPRRAQRCQRYITATRWRLLATERCAREQVGEPTIALQIWRGDDCACTERRERPGSSQRFEPRTTASAGQYHAWAPPENCGDTAAYSARSRPPGSASRRLGPRSLGDSWMMSPRTMSRR